MKITVWWICFSCHAASWRSAALVEVQEAQDLVLEEAESDSEAALHLTNQQNGANDLPRETQIQVEVIEQETAESFDLGVRTTDDKESGAELLLRRRRSGTTEEDPGDGKLPRAPLVIRSGSAVSEQRRRENEEEDSSCTTRPSTRHVGSWVNEGCATNLIHCYQSFVALSTGWVSFVRVAVSTTGNRLGRVRIFAGDCAGSKSCDGSRDHLGTSELGGARGVSVNTNVHNGLFQFLTPVHLTAGESYTFQVINVFAYSRRGTMYLYGAAFTPDRAANINRDVPFAVYVRDCPPVPRACTGVAELDFITTGGGGGGMICSNEQDDGCFQSFQPLTTGFLDRIRVKLSCSSYGRGRSRMTLFRGNCALFQSCNGGNAVNLLGSTSIARTVDWFCTGQGVEFRFVDPPIFVHKGETYTFQITGVWVYVYDKIAPGTAVAYSTSKSFASPQTMTFQAMVVTDCSRAPSILPTTSPVPTMAPSESEMPSFPPSTAVPSATPSDIMPSPSPSSSPAAKENEADISRLCFVDTPLTWDMARAVAASVSSSSSSEQGSSFSPSVSCALAPLDTTEEQDQVMVELEQHVFVQKYWTGFVVEHTDAVIIDHFAISRDPNTGDPVWSYEEDHAMLLPSVWKCVGGECPD